MSGPCGGVINMCGVLYTIHSITILTVCLGSLSCWKWKSSNNPNLRALSLKLFFEIFKYLNIYQVFHQ